MPMLRPVVPAQRPMARPRSCGSKTRVMIASVAGMIAAAPTPMSARVAMSCDALVAKVETSEPRPKTPIPKVRTLRRPIRSPSEPRVRRRPAKTRREESTLYGGPANRRVTVRDLQAAKDRGEKWAMLTSYDAVTARIFDEAGIPVLLIGDSVANNVLGYDNTVPVTLQEMLPFVQAVCR